MTYTQTKASLTPIASNNYRTLYFYYRITKIIRVVFNWNFVARHALVTKFIRQISIDGRTTCARQCHFQLQWSNRCIWLKTFAHFLTQLQKNYRIEIKKTRRVSRVAFACLIYRRKKTTRRVSSVVFTYLISRRRKALAESLVQYLLT